MKLYVLVLLLGVAAAVHATEKYPSGLPINAVLSAPWTPFGPAPTYALNLSVIPAYVKSIASGGVNVVWLAGTMGQFDAMTIAERKAFAAAFLPEAKKQGIYTIVHVGSTVQEEAIELAAHAKSINADAISAVPPFYNLAPTINDLVQFFVPIVEASGNLPFFYYHIPAMTNEAILMTDFMPVALQYLPSFAGVKFVDSHQEDYINVVGLYGDKIAFMWAPEPKLSSFLLGARGTVLAESFYGPTYLRMCHDVLSSNWTAAHWEQQWKYSAEAIFTKYGGTNAKRALYRKTAGIDIGTDRPPNSQPLTSQQYDELISELDKFGFFKQTTPEPCLLPKSW